MPSRSPLPIVPLHPQVYTQQLPEGASQADLLRMAAVPDRFDMESCAAACLAALAAKGAAGLEWAVVTSLFSLPPGVMALQGAQRLRELAQQRLQVELGDLEAALEDEQGRRQRLLALPFEALLALLRSDQARVAYESTAVAAASLWVKCVEGGLRAGQPLPLEQIRELAQCLRLCHVPPTYLATVVPRLPWLEGVVSTRDLVLAAGSAGLSKPGCLGEQWTAWLAAGKRPAAAAREAVVTWELTEAQLKAAYKSGRSATSSSSAVWVGISLT